MKKPKNLSKRITGDSKKKKFLITLLLATVILSALTSCGVAVPRPEIKEGRFDLSVTYEIGGKAETLSVVYVCEFDGTSWAIDSGYSSRDWRGYAEGNYKGDYNSAVVGTTDDGGDIILFFGVYPEYFMGDPEIGDSGIPEPSIYIVYPEDENGASSFVTEKEELKEVYGISIISYEYDEPIENSFSILNF